MVKSLGDGLMLEFADVKPAIQAAFAIQHASAQANREIASDRQILLRVGVHVGELITDEQDIYGRGVNLAARLTALAGPGEIVGSADVRDRLTPALDADVEDLGQCYLKHVRDPVRAYRIGPPGPRPVIDAAAGAMMDLRPAVAVIPFTARSDEPQQQVLGEVLADELISGLSRTPEMHVISRLSTTVFRDRPTTLGEVGALLHANYVLSGAYRVAGKRLIVSAELADAKSNHVVWSKSLNGTVAALLSGKDAVVDRLVADVSAAVMSRELERAQSQPLPTLESYALLIGAIAMMHRLSASDFDRARDMLQTLIDRVPRQPIPRAWLAKWHVLRTQQGWSDRPDDDARQALDCTRRALDMDPHCSLALAIDGFIHTNLLKQFDAAEERYELALSVNPNDSLAWLLKGTMHAFRGEGDLAVAGAERARRLSPLDPLRYFYDSLAATAALAAHDYRRARELARSSYRLNRKHASTLRALAIAQWHLGEVEDARKTVGELLGIDPGFTIKRFLERSPSSAFATGRVWSQALRDAGVPAGA
jgi:TolB-like protein